MHQSYTIELRLRNMIIRPIGFIYRGSFSNIFELVCITDNRRTADIDVHMTTTMREEGAGAFACTIVKLIIGTHNTVTRFVHGI